MEIATRRVHFAGCTPNPDGPWMQQIARNLTDVEEGFLKSKRYVLMDVNVRRNTWVENAGRTEAGDGERRSGGTPAVGEQGEKVFVARAGEHRR